MQSRIDLATIVYTSGSTGTPKGIELTHSNFVFITYSGISSMPDIAMNRTVVCCCSFHWRTCSHATCSSSASQVTSRSAIHNLKTILADFKAFKPTFILAVPRIFEKIYNAASQKGRSRPQRNVFSQVPRRRRATGRTHSSQAKAFRLS